MFIKKNDTTYLNTEILQFENNNNLIKDEIGRMNKEISDVQVGLSLYRKRQKMRKTLFYC